MNAVHLVVMKQTPGKSADINVFLERFQNEKDGLGSVFIRAVVCRLFRKLVNLLQKTVGYRLTFIQSSDLYFLSIHAILLELDHQCVHM